MTVGRLSALGQAGGRLGDDLGHAEQAFVPGQLRFQTGLVVGEGSVRDDRRDMGLLTVQPGSRDNDPFAGADVRAWVDENGDALRALVAQLRS